MPSTARTPASTASARRSMHAAARQIASLGTRLPARRAVALPLRLPPRAAPLYGGRTHVVRCLATKRDGDKSWAEIGEEVVEVAKDVGRKVAGGIGRALGAVVPSQEERAVRRREKEERRRREELFRPDLGGGIVGGLLGRAVGKMVSSALGAVGEQLQQAAEQAAEVQARAQAVIESSARVRDALGGGARCLAPVSQSSMTQNINGRLTQQVTLLLPVVGPSGRTAQAQVRYVEGSSGGVGEELDVSVRLPSGEVVQLGGGGGDGGAGGGRTIDVEWRSVD